jgi:DNA-binding IclR family transcriptional regulator
MGKKPGFLNKSAARVVDILDLIARENRAMTITEISSELKIPKSSTYNILQTLMSKRYVEIDDEKLKSFKLGFKLFQTGVTYLQFKELHQLAHPLLKEMMEESGETCFLAAEDEGRLVYLDAAETTTAIRTRARLGRSESPMYCSGLGKALLATYPLETVERIVAKDGFLSITKNTIRSREELERDLERTRKRGYAVDNREGNPGLICVAAPIRDGTNEAIAAISIATPYYKMDADKKTRFSSLVKKTAQEISRRLGYLSDDLY